jgi:hypothetical protein
MNLIVDHPWKQRTTASIDDPVCSFTGQITADSFNAAATNQQILMA